MTEETVVAEPVEQQEQYADVKDLGKQEETPQEQPPAYEMPEKFAGKSPEEIAQAYSNLEKELGRKGQEIGELRQLTDSYLKNQLQNQSSPEPVEAQEPEDFFDNPENSVRKIINDDPTLKELKQQADMQKQDMAVQQLQKSHPDYQDVLGDPKFQEWVGGSKIRTQLFQAADAYNFDAANELLGNWKERQLISNTQEAQKAEEDKRKTALKTGSGVSRSSSDSGTGKKIYRRADLIRLNHEDPMRYAALEDEILQAYQDGRVK